MGRQQNMGKQKTKSVRMLHGRCGVPFELDHSATDSYYPHLSLCGANSFFFGDSLSHINMAVAADQGRMGLCE